MKSEEDELVKMPPFPLRAWNRRVGASLASDQGTGVVFKDKSNFNLFTRQGEKKEWGSLSSSERKK